MDENLVIGPSCLDLLLDAVQVDIYGLKDELSTRSTKVTSITNAPLKILQVHTLDAGRRL